MFPLKPLLKRQKLAQLLPATKLRFAVLKGFCDSIKARRTAAPCSDSMQTCYPFPLPWPGPLRVRSFFFVGSPKVPALRRRFGAWRMRLHSFAFQMQQNLIESLSINNKIRGDLSCVNPLSFSALRPLACLAASTTTSRAALRVPPLVDCWQMSPMATSLRARLLAALRAPSAMTLAFAAHVTDLIAASRARRTYPTTQWPFAQSARVAILISSPRGRRSAFCFSERDSHV